MKALKALVIVALTGSATAFACMQNTQSSIKERSRKDVAELVASLASRDGKRTSQPTENPSTRSVR